MQIKLPFVVLKPAVLSRDNQTYVIIRDDVHWEQHTSKQGAKKVYEEAYLQTVDVNAFIQGRSRAQHVILSDLYLTAVSLQVRGCYTRLSLLPATR